MSFFNRKKRNDAEIDQESIEGERSVASVNKGLGTQTRITNIVITVGVIALVLFLLVQYYTAMYKRHQEAKAAGKADASKTIITNLPPLKPLPLAAEPALSTYAPPSPVAQLQGRQAAAPGAQSQQALTPEEAALQRRLKSGVFFKAQASSGGGGGGAAGGQAGGGYGAAGGAGGNGEDAASDPLSKSLQPSRQAGARAYMLADPSLMITKGAVIPCSVIPAIDSTLPGIVTCMQTADVYSTDGKVVLLERGTRWVGEQKFGLSQGQKRLGMLWTRGETPNHVLIDVDSGTADNLGRAGISGEVDTHFWDRFGGAILVSLIGDVGSFLAATQQPSGGGNATAIAFPGTVNGAQSAMSDILKSTLSIPPTLTKNQGASISIYVARDLDFRDVYALESKQ